MMKKIQKKLKSNAGESIAEVLVAVLISALALVLLAGMINASARLIKDSRVNMGEYYELNEPLAIQAAGGTEATISFTDGIKLVQGESSTSVYLYKNEKQSATPVLAYRKK